jgi:hypothetical protein
MVVVVAEVLRLLLLIGQVAEAEAVLEVWEEQQSLITFPL